MDYKQVIHAPTSEQPDDIAFVVDVDFLGRGVFGQTRHGHDVACQRDDESGARTQFHVT